MMPCEQLREQQRALGALGGLAAIPASDIEELYNELGADFGDLKFCPWLDEEAALPSAAHVEAAAGLAHGDPAHGDLAHGGLARQDTLTWLSLIAKDGMQAGTVTDEGTDSNLKQDLLEAVSSVHDDGSELGGTDDDGDAYFKDKVSGDPRWKARTRTENKLKKLLGEEEDLDCDLRCLVAAKRARGPEPELESHIATFDKLLRSLEQARIRSMASLARAFLWHSTVPPAKKAALNDSEYRWTVRRLMLKRKLFLATLSTSDVAVGYAKTYQAAIATLAHISGAAKTASIKGQLPTGPELLAMPRQHKLVPEQAKQLLLSWCKQHDDHPWPSREQKKELTAKTGLTALQITYWLGNYRVRHWTKRNNSPARKKHRRHSAPPYF